MINKFKKTDPKLILTAVLGLLFAGVVILFLSIKLGFISPGRIEMPGRTADNAQVPTGPVVVNVSTVKLDNATVKLYLNPKSTKDISAFSVRLNYDASKNPEVVPVSFTPDSTLVAAGWSFPIKKISVADNKMVSIDVSGLFINPKAFTLSNPIIIGTINFTPNTENLSLTTTLARSETKILEKNANELNYDFTSQ